MSKDKKAGGGKAKPHAPGGDMGAGPKGGVSKVHGKPHAAGGKPQGSVAKQHTQTAGGKKPHAAAAEGKPAKGSSKGSQKAAAAAAAAPAATTSGEGSKKKQKIKHGRSKHFTAPKPKQPKPVAPPMPTKSTDGFSSNWQAIKKAVGATGEGKKRKAEEEASTKAASAKRLQSKGTNTGLTQYIAMDCEMVGVGPDGSKSIIARVCIVNNDGNVLLDTHVRPKEKVTDYRTWVSGVKPEHLMGDDVPSLEEVQEKVAKMLKGNILVGHALNNDLKALLLDHPRKDTRDTAKYPPLMRAPAPGRKPRARALRNLSREELGLVIQEGEHSPVDDARAALYIYHKHRKEWERAIATGSLFKAKAKDARLRKAIRVSLEERAGDNKAAARKARQGKGKGQVKIAMDVKRQAQGRQDPYNKAISEDIYADL